jgi:N6-L-threonylcarbamoyladenine synthase
MVNDYTSYEILGRTRDDAAGEAYDKIARVLGLGYPGGAAIEKAALGGNPHAYKLPITEFEDCHYDFSFSGLKTNVINLVHHANQSGEKVNVADISATFNQTVSDTLASKFKRAAVDKRADKLVVAGGVAANNLLRSRLGEVAAELGVKLYIPPMNLCGDNAAMIGAQGYYEYLMGNIADLSLNGYATMGICQNYSNII